MRRLFSIQLGARPGERDDVNMAKAGRPLWFLIDWSCAARPRAKALRRQREKAGGKNPDLWFHTTGRRIRQRPRAPDSRPGERADARFAGNPHADLASKRCCCCCTAEEGPIVAILSRGLSILSLLSNITMRPDGAVPGVRVIGISGNGKDGAMPALRRIQAFRGACRGLEWSLPGVHGARIFAARHPFDRHPQTTDMIMNRASIVILVTLGLLAASCAKDKKSPESARPEAVEYYVKGEEARRAGDSKQAEQQYQAAVQKNPNLRMAHSRLGDIYKGRGDYEGASQHYEAVSRLDPYNFLSHYNLGLAYHFLNRMQDAGASYLRALNLKPTDVKSNMNLGLVYLALGQYDDAVKYLTRATELDPQSAVAWSNLGVALDARGDAAQAETKYRRALELDSTSATTLQNLASNLISQGKAREAITVMEQVITRVDTASTRKRYGDALALAKRYDEAIKQYDIALKRDPRFYPAMNEKGFVLIRQYRDGLELDEEKRKSAVALWRDSLKLNANQLPLRRQLEKAENPSLFGTGQ